MRPCVSLPLLLTVIAWFVLGIASAIEDNNIIISQHDYDDIVENVYEPQTLRGHRVHRKSHHHGIHDGPLRVQFPIWEDMNMAMEVGMSGEKPGWRSRSGMGKSRIADYGEAEELVVLSQALPVTGTAKPGLGTICDPKDSAQCGLH